MPVWRLRASAMFSARPSTAVTCNPAFFNIAEKYPTPHPRSSAVCKSSSDFQGAITARKNSTRASRDSDCRGRSKTNGLDKKRPPAGVAQRGHALPLLLCIPAALQPEVERRNAYLSVAFAFRARCAHRVWNHSSMWRETHMCGSAPLTVSEWLRGPSRNAPSTGYQECFASRNMDMVRPC